MDWDVHWWDGVTTGKDNKKYKRVPGSLFPEKITVHMYILYTKDCVKYKVEILITNHSIVIESIT